jgi:hypothetical protein
MAFRNEIFSHVYSNWLQSENKSFEFVQHVASVADRGGSMCWVLSFTHGMSMWCSNTIVSITKCNKTLLFFRWSFFFSNSGIASAVNEEAGLWVCNRAKHLKMRFLQPLQSCFVTRCALWRTSSHAIGKQHVFCVVACCLSHQATSEVCRSAELVFISHSGYLLLLGAMQYTYYSCHSLERQIVAGEKTILISQEVSLSSENGRRSRNWYFLGTVSCITLEFKIF